MVLEIIDEVSSVLDAKRVGVKITPGTTLNDSSDSNETALYDYFLEELNKRGILFVDCVDKPY